MTPRTRSGSLVSRAISPLLMLALFFSSATPLLAQTTDAATDTAESKVAPAPEAAKAPEAAADAKRPYNEEAIQHYNRGHDLHQQGFFNQAITEYKAALAADDRMEESYTNLGLIYAAQRNYTKAQEAFKKSLLLNPNRPNSLNGLGTVLYARNKLNEAMEKWRAAVALDPRFASAYYNMGNALENEKDLPGAIEAYSKALSVAPTMADAYYRIGTIYAKQKHAAQANTLLSKAIQLQPTAEFVHDAKKTLTILEADLEHGSTDEPEVQMNIMTPPSSDADSKSGGG